MKSIIFITIISLFAISSLAQDSVSTLKGRILKYDGQDKGIAVNYNSYKENTSIKGFNTVKYQRWDSTEYILTDSSLIKSNKFNITISGNIHFPGRKNSSKPKKSLSK